MTFTPQLINVTDISRSRPAVVTTETDHNLATGQIVRLIVPKAYGMKQANNQLYIISYLSATTFSLQFSQVPVWIDVDSTGYDAFVNAGTGTPAQCSPVGSGPTPDRSTFLNIRNDVATTTLQDTTTNNSTVPIPF